MKNAFKMFVAFLPQSTSGATDSALLDPNYRGLTFGTNNLIPLDYEFTNVSKSSSTVETRDVNFISDLDLWTRRESGKISQGDISFASERPLDVASIIARLEAITGVENPFLGVLKIGVFKSEATGARTYDVVFTTAAIFAEDGSLSANAKDILTSTTRFVPSGRPTEGIAANAQTMTVNLATNVVTLSPSGAAASGGYDN